MSSSPQPGTAPRRVLDASAARGRWHPDRNREPHLPGHGITAYLENSGKLKIAQYIANHGRTTNLHDRRQDEISLYEVERTRPEAPVA